MKPSIASSSAVSLGQKTEFIQLVLDAVRKSVGVIIDELTETGVLNTANLQRVLSKGDRIVAVITKVVKEEIANIAESILNRVKLISGADGLELDETDGKETIAKAGDTFPGWIDSDFEDYGTNVAGAPTTKTKADVHEMIENGTFMEIFGGMSDDLNSLCFTQSQIIQFVKKHRKWLRTERNATFFLFKVGEKFFVADVDFDSRGRLEVGVDYLSLSRVWFAVYRHRIVSPKLVLSN